MPNPQYRAVVRAVPKTRHVRVATLEGMFQPAGFVSRLVAFVIDIIIVSVGTVVFAAVANLVLRFFGIGAQVLRLVAPGQITNLISRADILVTGVLTILFVPAYFVIFWVLVGATPGKQVLGLKVVHDDQVHIAWLRAIVRFIAYFISALVFFMGFIWVFFDRNRQGWHDKIARTYVIYVWEVPPEG